jgi:hypothetical protein
MNLKKIIFIVLFAAFIVYYVSQNKDLSGYGNDAVTFVQEHVKSQLKNPNSASFEVDKTPVIYGGDGKYEVKGAVDYQNDSGATVRDSYRATLVKSGETDVGFTIEKFEFLKRVPAQ